MIQPSLTSAVPWPNEVIIGVNRTALIKERIAVVEMIQKHENFLLKSFILNCIVHPDQIASDRNFNFFPDYQIRAEKITFSCLPPDFNTGIVPFPKNLCRCRGSCFSI